MSLHNVDPITPWDELLVEPPNDKVEPPATQKKHKKTTIKEKVEPPNDQNEDPKILDEGVIWAILCDLRGSVGIDTILGWITTTPPKNVEKFVKGKVEITRSNIVLALIKLCRTVKKEGYL